MQGFVEGRVGVAVMRSNAVEAAFRRTGLAARRRRRVAPDLPAPDRWAIARVRWGREFEVADDLSESGMFGYAPHVVVTHRSARVNGSNSVRRAVERDYPVFPGYVFVGCPTGVYVSRRTHDAIFGVLGDELGLPGVSQGVMQGIHRLHVEGLWRAPPKPSLKAGQGVVIEDVGGLTLAGVVASLPGELRAIVEVSIFGRATRIDIGLDKIKSAVL